MIVEAELVARLVAFGRDAREEVCGALLGDDAHIRQHWPLANCSSRRGDRYFIPAQDVLQVERQAAKVGLVLVGFYHSHPRGQAVPSRTDLANALPGYIYIIISATGGLRLWRLREDRSGFTEVHT